MTLPPKVPELSNLRDKLAYFDLIVFTHIDLREGRPLITRALPSETLSSLRDLREMMTIEQDTFAPELRGDLDLYIVYASILIMLLANSEHADIT